MGRYRVWDSERGPIYELDTYPQALAQAVDVANTAADASGASIDRCREPEHPKSCLLHVERPETDDGASWWIGTFRIGVYD